MIVKLAHLTFATGKTDVEKMCGCFVNHHIQFSEKGLANIPAKELFSRSRMRTTIWSSWKVRKESRSRSWAMIGALGILRQNGALKKDAVPVHF